MPTVGEAGVLPSVALMVSHFESLWALHFAAEEHPCAEFIVMV
jgi:hypothetical protein